MIKIIPILIAIVFTCSLRCNEYKTQKKSDKYTLLDNTFNKLNSDGLFNGELLIKQNNEIIIHKYYGNANLETNKSFTNNSVFEIASVSKPITVFTILKLIDSGKINFYDKIGKFIPELSNYDVTVEQLITHSSGLVDYAQVLYPNWNPNNIADNDDLLKILIDKKPPLLFTPGTQWKYTNIGYTLIAIIVEKITGIDFETYCQQEIFIPFNMSKTSIPKQQETHTLNGYVNDYIYSFGDAKYIDPQLYPSFDNATFTGDMNGAQGICTNATDLSKFIEHALINKEGLSEAQYEKYITPNQLKTPMSDYFTTGWFYEENSQLGSNLFYVGGFSGYRSLLQSFKNQNITVVVLSNTFTTPIWSIKKIIDNILSGSDFEYPKRSYVRLLSKSIHGKEKLNQQYSVKYDSTKHQFKEYEFDEYLEDLSIKKDTSKIIFALEEIITQFPDLTKYSKELRKLKEKE